MKEMNGVLELLSMIEQDNSVPKNIRCKIKEAMDCLNNSQIESSVTVDKAIQNLDELSGDPNVPMFTRTQIWSAISALESK
jgi:hypothetical protein